MPSKGKSKKIITPLIHPIKNKTKPLIIAPLIQYTGYYSVGCNYNQPILIPFFGNGLSFYTPYFYGYNFPNNNVGIGDGSYMSLRVIKSGNYSISINDNTTGDNYCSAPIIYPTLNISVNGNIYATSDGNTMCSYSGNFEVGDIIYFTISNNDPNLCGTGFGTLYGFYTFIVNN